MRVKTLEIEITFGASDKEPLALIDPVESSEINIGAIHNVNRSGFDDEFIQDVNIMRFPLGYKDERGNAAAQVQQRMKFYGALSLAKFRPRKQRKT